jgi:AbiTii
MNLLHQVQANLLDENAAVGTALLKLRFLASRLGSELLEGWVRHEIEGYANDADVPEYRRVGITYSGTFTNGYQSMNDTPIPLSVVRKQAGESWVKYEFRDGISVIDEAVRRAQGKDGGTYQIDCGNLILLLTDKLYQGYTCISVRGLFDSGAFVRVQSTVRAKALDLCMRIEKELPAATEITVGPSTMNISTDETAQVTQIFNQTFNAPYTAITSTGAAATFQLNVSVGDQSSLQKALADQGMRAVEAIELAEIVASERPESEDEPFGAKAKAWIAEKAKHGASDIWKFGLDVAKDAIKQYVKQFYFGG